ncbi:MAG: hypothetical protein PWR01_3163 [Clostridiales bacterium]|jgi:hypothetical protein|nr:hypothetical protein [Clostridiales bacterium]MDN5282090.1 hypothetical protein [Candidatus Ozemobacter sp.]
MPIISKGENMKKLWLILIAVVLVGCNDKPKSPASDAKTASQTSGLASSAPFQANTISVVASESKKPKQSPLELAQSEYLSSYDNYVRLLRESGPQTLETLEALASYQKKYQLYQMLLKAEKGETAKKN